MPVKVGVVSFVMPSEDDEPESELADSAGAEGAEGALVS